jgi:PTS hybrid protein
MTVGLVIVSHSALIADGVCQLAAQMAPDVPLVPAGGAERSADGNAGIGTSFDKVQAAIGAADQGEGAVILTDLGSAVMTAETALEFVHAGQRPRILLARAALVEGAVAAAVQAQTGADVHAVLKAAEAAIVSIEPSRPELAGPGPLAELDGAAGAETGLEGSWVLANPMGLHARPAALIARTMADFDAEVSINGVDAKSVMLLMSLGLGQGQTMAVKAVGPDARQAFEYIAGEVQSGFGET